MSDPCLEYSWLHSSRQLEPITDIKIPHPSVEVVAIIGGFLLAEQVSSLWLVPALTPPTKTVVAFFRKSLNDDSLYLNYDTSDSGEIFILYQVCSEEQSSLFKFASSRNIAISANNH